MHRLLPALLTTLALNAVPSWSQTAPQPLSAAPNAAAHLNVSQNVAGWPLLVQARGGVGLVNFGGGGQNAGPAVGLGASVVHRGTGLMLTGRALAADLRNFTERAVMLGYDRSLGPFFLSAGAGVGYARARYGPASWTIGEPEPVVRDYASIGLPVEAQAAWQARFLAVYLSHARTFNEEVPFSSTMLGLQLQLGRSR
jgi:hypothetical protein